jgi:L-asparaginase II
MAHPELIAGERREMDTALMRAAPGKVVSKGGAEGVQAVGVMAGARGKGSSAAGLAVKIEDGDRARRGRNVATLESLRQLGVLDAAAVERLAEYASPPIRDPRGVPSGEVRPAFSLA